MKERMSIRLNSLLVKIFFVAFVTTISNSAYSEEKKIEFIKNDWSFEGIFGTFDRSSLQRGYQVYQEVCSGCHSIQHLSYRNLSDNLLVLINISPSSLGPSVTSNCAAIALASSNENSGPPFSDKFL